MSTDLVSTDLVLPPSCRVRAAGPAGLRERPRRQAGAVLVTALLFLTIITLIGLAAMASGRLNLRLALNEETHLDAMESAQSVLDSLLASATYFAVRPGSDYVQACYLPPASKVDRATLSSQYGFSCPESGADAITLPDATLANYAYAAVRRESVGGMDYAPMSALREGDSGLRYRLASFSVIAGYDRTKEGMNAAEINHGAYIKVDSIPGLTLR